MDNHVLINILKDTLAKKINILDRLIEETSNQEQYISLKRDNLEEFEEIVERKDLLLNELSKLDDGFERVYERVSEIIKENKTLYQKNIMELKDAIRIVLEKSTLLERKEKNNQEKLKEYFIHKKKEIKSFNVSNQAVSNYYKNSSDGYRGESIFLDKKK